MDKIKGPLFLAAAFGLAGTSVIAAHIVSGKLGTFTIASVSLLLAFLALVPFTFKRLAAALPRLKAAQWLSLLVQAASGIFLFRLFFLQGILRTSAGEAGLLTGAMPAFTAVLAWAVLRERVSFNAFLGIVSSVAGIFLVQGLWGRQSGLSLSHLSGNALVLAAVLSESVFNVFSRYSALKSDSLNKISIDPLVQTSLVSVIALFLCLLPAVFEDPLVKLAGLGSSGWLALGWYGVIVTAAGFVFWYAGIKRSRAFTAAAMTGCMPLTAWLLSIFLLGESQGWQQWAGGILVIAGIILIAGPVRPKRITVFQRSMVNEIDRSNRHA